MGLFSNLFSKRNSSEQQQASSSSDTSPTTTTNAAQASSNSAASQDAPPSFEASTASQPGPPPPGYGAGSYKAWPAVPHAGDYERRVSEMDAEAKSKPRKKSWIKDKLDLAGPDDKEYYDRRWTKSGNGCDYEQNSVIASVAGCVMPTSTAKQILQKHTER